MAGGDQVNGKRQNKKINSNEVRGFVVVSNSLSEEVTLSRELNEVKERVAWTSVEKSVPDGGAATTKALR